MRARHDPRRRAARQRGPDPVAQNPVHGALVAVHGLDHPVEHRVEEELLGGLGVAVGKQLHRTLDIGEQHGDLLAFTLEGRPRDQDLFGKVLRCVTPGRGKSGNIRNRRQAMAAFGAELGCGRHLAATVNAGSRERSRTLLAELRLKRVLVLALRAFHRRPRGKQRAGCTNRLTSRVTGNKV
jgi:hypothetical protein